MIIPLGEECYTCQSIDGKISNNHLRKCAFPFDYVAGPTVHSLYRNFYDLFINNIMTDDLDFEIEKIEIMNGNYYFKNKKYGYVYWHDVLSNDGNFTQEETTKFITKYKRRYERLINKIKNNSEPITFLSVNHFHSVYHQIHKKEAVIKLYDLLYSINNNIKFIAINYNNEDSRHNNLQFVNLNVNRDIPIEESKKIFTETLYAFVSKNLQ
jgi:hypothetical protein